MCDRNSGFQVFNNLGLLPYTLLYVSLVCSWLWCTGYEDNRILIKKQTWEYVLSEQ